MNASIANPYAAFEIFSTFYMALLIGLGTFGNGFCIVAYMTSEVKKYGATRYLIALSMSDLGFVVCMALTWLTTFNLNWQALSGVCEISTYLSSVCCFLSGWYVTALSGERCLAVCWPYLARRVCTASRTTLLIIILALVGAAINSPLFYLAKSVSGNDLGQVETPVTTKSDEKTNWAKSRDQSMIGQYRADHRNFGASWRDRNSVQNFWNEDDLWIQKNGEVAGLGQIVFEIDHLKSISTTPRVDAITYHCGVNPKTETVYRAFTTIDTVISFTIPLVLTLLLNVAIAYTLCRAARERTKLTTTYESMGRSRTGTVSGKQLAKPKLADESPQLSQRMHREENRRNALLITQNNGRVVSRTAGVSGNCKLVERKVTSILVAKCIAYLILNLPSYLHRIVLAFEAPLGGESSQKMNQEEQRPSVVNNRIVEMVVYLLFYTQFSTNFLLYSFNSCVNGAIRMHTDSFRRSIRNGNHV